MSDKKKLRNETISEWVRQLVNRERDKKWMGGKKVDRWDIKWMGDKKNGGMRQEIKWRDKRWKWEMREKSEQVRQKMEGWDRKRRDQIGLLVTFFLGGGGEKLYIISKSWVHDHTHPYPNPQVGTFLERASFHIMQGIPESLIPFTFELRFIFI